MQIIRTISELRNLRQQSLKREQSLALVPTMGALHEGHLSLARAALEKADIVIVSIFVNPTQFGPNEDYSSYPRMLEDDANKLEAIGVKYIYAPNVDDIYPEGHKTSVHIDDLGECLCGAARPGHFDGVATIVTKLLAQSRADYAFFGEKDWQQLQIIRRLNADLDLGVDIIGVEICREKQSGLALSSRNAYLNDDELIAARQLNAILRQYGDSLKAGIENAKAEQEARSELKAIGFSQIDYLECRHGDDLDLITNYQPGINARIFVAAKIGKARLIDNMPV